MSDTSSPRIVQVCAWRAGGKLRGGGSKTPPPIQAPPAESPLTRNICTVILMGLLVGSAAACAIRFAVLSAFNSAVECRMSAEKGAGAAGRIASAFPSTQTTAAATRLSILFTRQNHTSSSADSPDDYLRTLYSPALLSLLKTMPKNPYNITQENAHKGKVPSRPRLLIYGADPNVKNRVENTVLFPLVQSLTWIHTHIVVYNSSEIIDPRDYDLALIFMIAHLPMLQHMRPILQQIPWRLYYHDSFCWMKKEELQTLFTNRDVICCPIPGQVEELKRLCKNCTQVTHLPWGVHEGRAHFHPWQKSDHPIILVDHDNVEERKGAHFLDNFYTAVSQLQTTTFPFLTTVALAADEPRANVSYPMRLPHKTYARLMRQSWIYVTGVSGSYENGIAEAQMSGSWVLSLKHAMKPSLVRESITAFDVPEDVYTIKKTVEIMIQTLQPDKIRKFALKWFGWSSVLQKFRKLVEGLMWLRQFEKN